MAHNKLYRNFIILQEDERGYSHSNDKALSGYAKVEAKGDKCKVSFYAQNLRQEDNYSMVLICCKRELKQLIDLGPLAINGVGKGDTSKDYYVNNIAGLGMSYEKISGAAICKVKDNETEFIMHGFMNGEDSSENWRRFKIIKVDSKKCSNKLDEELKKKDISSLDIADKAIISNNVETKIVKTSKLESGLVERKKDEKENIELETLNNNNSKVEDKQQNRIPENSQSIVEAINVLDEDRNKCKEAKKCDKCEKNENIEEAKKYGKCEINENIEEDRKCGKCETNENIEEDRKCGKCETNENIEEDRKCGKCETNENTEEDRKCGKCEKKENIEETKKCDKHEMHENIEETKKCDKHEMHESIEETKKCDKHEAHENIEETINRLAKKLETYDGVIDLRINNVHEDVIIYGFIKDKENCDCKWKKFKIEKKCRSENEDFNNIQGNSKRIEENFKLDKLNEIDRADRIDRLDIIDFDEYENDIQKAGAGNMDQTKSGTVDQTSTGNMGQTCSEAMWQPICQSSPSNMQQSTSNQDFNISGEVGKYFEKLAEDFEPYKGSLADINYCKLYKINVNSIEDLSDESNYNKYTLAYYPMLNYYPYIGKKGYFLLGYKCNGNGEMKYIIYAIPGSKDKNDQPYGGRTGFVTWTSDNTNGRGYWLMFYDFKNSSIVIPTK